VNNTHDTRAQYDSIIPRRYHGVKYTFCNHRGDDGILEQYDVFNLIQLNCGHSLQKIH